MTIYISTYTGHFIRNLTTLTLNTPRTFIVLPPQKKMCAEPLERNVCEIHTERPNSLLKICERIKTEIIKRLNTLLLVYWKYNNNFGFFWMDPLKWFYIKNHTVVPHVKCFYLIFICHSRFCIGTCLLRVQSSLSFHKVLNTFLGDFQTFSVLMKPTLRWLALCILACYNAGNRHHKTVNCGQKGMHVVILR